MSETNKITFNIDNDFKEGAVFAVDKPLNWTSFDVVNKIRYCLKKQYGKLKVGHAGTLDPLATGIVIICTGKKTKEIENYMGHEKEYVAQITFGNTTPSYDLETEFDETYPREHITLPLIEEKLQQFKGDIEQAPPVFSAIKVDGVKAYKKARVGQDIELKKRPVTIKNIEVINFNNPLLEIKVTCGKGTYIRSLAHDLGKACDSGSHLSALRRTRVGDFDIDNAYKMDEIIGFLNENEYIS